ncbi:MAG: DHH family phosphoesterase [Candidatus Eisenbacteria bacterium]|uniref:DHH family phosphoesterase n=1 Tax=Eiseniibacteriota bacterium TaxID=2212470 RepID=A0A956M280_UNCEI|nr:DHH family phosphoesterase [Candidatus Eisenbacteria bacterium]
MAPWEGLEALLGSARRILLTSHVYPEADSIGSEVALALHLRHLGKEVVVANETPVLERYHFLARLFPVLSLDELGPPDPDAFDLVVFLDVSSWDYTGKVGDWVRAAGLDVVAVDHHHPNGPFGVLEVIHEDAASAGEVLYHYFQWADALITPAMAEALYASLLFDTQGFRLGNTRNETLRVANHLLDLGANHRDVCRHLFEVESWTRMHLLRLALGTLQRQCGGRLAWLSISEDLFRLAGAEFVDGDGILDHLLALKGVEVCAMFRQLDQRGIKVTFRSKGLQDVGALAEGLGGGGRRTASGALLTVSMHQAIEEVLPKVRALLDEPVRPRERTTELAPSRS